MTPELTQFTISAVTPAYWQVRFSNPPINLQDPDTILELQELVSQIETDDALRVVVLESVTIAKIRGRNIGGGREAALAFDWGGPGHWKSSLGATTSMLRRRGSTAGSTVPFRR
jgi:enoyl-CoA hydratase/carnithine racemase